MKNTYYKIKYTQGVTPVVETIIDLNQAIDKYNELKALEPSVSNIKFFIVNNIEEELNESQIPTK